ncbi:ATP-binding protein [Bifidobacterium choloepi]|uniref:ATP-binding protein n=1 Tax=Bifidobacterium choloepi TaxID=2614131 RepID=UPI001E5BE319|nr:ATP-binding protein [Bifidobacterium choloepi]
MEPDGIAVPAAPIERQIGARLPLLRPRSGKWLAGVCRGTALHLGISVVWTRLAFLALACYFGVGALAYVLLWIFIPAGDPQAEAARLASPLNPGGPVLSSARAALDDSSATARTLYGSGHPAGHAGSPATRPLARGNNPLFGTDAAADAARGTMAADAAGTASGNANGTAAGPMPASAAASLAESSTASLLAALRNAPVPALVALGGIVCIALAVLVASPRFDAGLAVPALLAASGIALAWIRTGGADAGAAGTPDAAADVMGRRGSLGAMVGGLALIFVAYAVLMTQAAWGTGVITWPRGVIGGLGLLLCTIVAIIPWMMHLVRANATERAQKEREEERADMAAHLHDGVLQTLALIQLNAADQQRVVTLARSQERELRNWLYRERVPSDRSFSAGIEDIAADVERTHGKAIDVVTVGDAEPSTQTDAILAATTQALVNAAVHGAEPISVYAEVGADGVDVFVRDHGDGFDADLSRLPDGRFGIRESIVGRLERRGGHVEIVSRPGWGTEVRMHIPMSERSDR